MHNYIDFFWSDIKKISADTAKEYLQSNAYEVFELLPDRTLKKTNLHEIVETKIYGVKDNKFTFSDFLENEKNLFGYALFCRDTDNICEKMNLAYELLKFMLPNLKNEQKEKCQQFVDTIRKKFKLKEKQTPQCYNSAQDTLQLLSDDEFAGLWDEIQIFFQEMCPPNWYFVRRENHEYVFIFISEKK